MAEKKIGTRTFRTEPMLAMDAMRLQARLLRVVGPALSRLGEIMQGIGDDKSEEQKAKSNAAAISAFTDIFSNSDPDQLADLIRDVVEIAQVKRPSGAYDSCDIDGDFTQHKGDIIPVAVFVLREQFGDFFSGLPGIGNPGKRAKD